MKKSIIPILLLLTLALGTLLRIHNLGNVPGRSPDESVHTYQANTILREGSIMGTRKLVREYNGDSRQWMYPKPIRIGYLWPLAGIMKITGRNDVALGANLSSFFSILSLVIVMTLGLRFFNKWVALYALLFMSVSPIALAISRRTWSDAMLECLGLLLVYLSCEIIRKPNKVILYLPFTVVGACAALVKESGALFYALCAIWILCVLLVKEKAISKGVLLIAASIVGAGASVACTAYVSGGLPNALEAMRHFSEALPGNTYAVEYQTGPWYRFVGGFWIISPLSAILCLVGIAGAKPGFAKPGFAYGIAGFMTAVIVMTIIAPLSQNMRYISPLFGAFYLLGGLGFWNIVSRAKAKLSNFYFSVAMGWLVILVILAAVSDYGNFKKIFVKTGIVDTSIGLLYLHAR